MLPAADDVSWHPMAPGAWHPAQPRFPGRAQRHFIVGPFLHKKNQNQLAPRSPSLYPGCVSGKTSCNSWAEGDGPCRYVSPVPIAAPSPKSATRRSAVAFAARTARRSSRHRPATRPSARVMTRPSGGHPRRACRRGLRCQESRWPSFPNFVWERTWAKPVSQP